MAHDSDGRSASAPEDSSPGWQQGDVALEAVEFIPVRLASRRPAGDAEDADGLFDAVLAEVRGLSPS